MTQAAMNFDGATFDQSRDGPRLNRQLQTVFNVVKDGRWRTLHAIAEQTGEPEASVSARLRDLRKARFGGHVVEREFLGGGVWQYRLRVGE